MKKLLPVKVTKVEDVVIEQFLCMITYKSEDCHKAWLTHKEMTSYIRSEGHYDYYYLGETREVVVGRREVIHTEYKEIEVTRKQLETELIEELNSFDPFAVIEEKF